LTGAPAARRVKTYSAETGYVYEYYYEGRRPADGAPGGIEFVFGVSAGRAPIGAASVVLGGDVIAGWQRRHQRELSSTELYAVAKMALFQAFDERHAPARMKDAVVVRELDVEAFGDALGFD